MSDITKKCIICCLDLPMDEFYYNRAAKDKKQSRCKKCVAKYNQNYRANRIANNTDKKRSYALKLTNVKKSDYHKMYKLLKEIGYDVGGNIHEQFCAKYDLKTKIRPKKMQNMYNASDFDDL